MKYNSLNEFLDYVKSRESHQPEFLQAVEEVPPPPEVKETKPTKEPVVTTRKSGTDTIEEYRIGD